MRVVLSRMKMGNVSRWIEELLQSLILGIGNYIDIDNKYTLALQWRFIQLACHAF